MVATPRGTTIITKPMAKIKKIARTIFGSNSIMDFIRPEDSATEATVATVVFFANAMRVLPSGVMEPRKAWGKIIRRALAKNPRPMARAASACV